MTSKREKQKKRPPAPPRPPPVAHQAPTPDPWKLPAAETEHSNPALEEPNPLASTPMPLPSAKPSPPEALPPEQSAKPRATPEQARPAVRLVLELASAALDPETPVTDAEVMAVAEPAAEGLPPWLFAWWLRLSGALAEFVVKRLQARSARAQAPRKNVTPTESAPSSPAAPA